MGKNTMVRRAIKGFISDFPEYERLLPHVKGNVGFVFVRIMSLGSFAVLTAYLRPMVNSRRSATKF